MGWNSGYACENPVTPPCYKFTNSFWAGLTAGRSKKSVSLHRGDSSNCDKDKLCFLVTTYTQQERKNVGITMTWRPSALTVENQVSDEDTPGVLTRFGDDAISVTVRQRSRSRNARRTSEKCQV